MCIPASQDLTLAWSGGDANAYFLVTIAGSKAGHSLGVSCTFDPGLVDDGALRIFVEGDLRYSQANEAAGLPDISDFLGAGVDWNPRQ